MKSNDALRRKASLLEGGLSFKNELGSHIQRINILRTEIGSYRWCPDITIWLSAAKNLLITPMTSTEALNHLNYISFHIA